MDTDNYEDIIGLSRPVMPLHPPMPLRDRAAQFAPFAALTGYDDAIRETARLTDRRIPPDDETERLLNGQIQRIRERLSERPAAEITYFVPDERKAGGKYLTVSGRVRQIDDFNGVLILTDRRRVALDDILCITLPQPERG